jgi:hypothetical protein
MRGWPGQAQRRVNVDFPTWMIESLDGEAGRLGVTRRSIIKVWIADRLLQKGSRSRGRTSAADGISTPKTLGSCLAPRTPRA